MATEPVPAGVDLYPVKYPATLRRYVEVQRPPPAIVTHLTPRLRAEAVAQAARDAHGGRVANTRKPPPLYKPRPPVSAPCVRSVAVTETPGRLWSERRAFANAHTSVFAGLRGLDGRALCRNPFAAGGADTAGHAQTRARSCAPVGAGEVLLCAHRRLCLEAQSAGSQQKEAAWGRPDDDAAGSPLLECHARSAGCSHSRGHH